MCVESALETEMANTERAIRRRKDFETPDRRDYNSIMETTPISHAQTRAHTPGHEHQEHLWFPGDPHDINLGDR